MVKEENTETEALMKFLREYMKQAPEQRKHEINLLLIKVGLLVAILGCATILTIYGKFSQDLATALYVAAFGYLLGTLK